MRTRLVGSGRSRCSPGRRTPGGRPASCSPSKRGVEIWHHADPSRDRSEIARRAGALPVVRSWLGAPALPTEAEVSAVSGRGDTHVTVRRNWTKVSRDDLPPGSGASLWGDYYQAQRSPGGRGSGGLANLLELFLGRPAMLDLPPGYLFISYRQFADREFVQDRLRPCLAREGFTAWDYRSSERAADRGSRNDSCSSSRERRRCWSWRPRSDTRHGPVSSARRQGGSGSRFLGVRPPTARSVPPVILGGGRTHVIRPGQTPLPV